MEHYWKSDQESRPQGVGHLLHCGEDALHSSQVGFGFLSRQFETSYFVRYQTFRDAMDICEEMGERGSFLKKFETFEEYDIFHENAKKSKAIDAYCEHGGRFIFWLPYRQDLKISPAVNVEQFVLSRGYDDITGTVNVTYFGDESPFELTTMWRKNNPKSSQRPFCVATRLGESRVDILMRHAESCF